MPRVSTGEDAAAPKRKATKRTGDLMVTNALTRKDRAITRELDNYYKQQAMYGQTVSALHIAAILGGGVLSHR